MSDYDYGREKGLWGNDGMPYAVKYERSSSYSTPKKSTTKNLNYSEKLAVRNGFELIPDEDAYNGRYFIKNGMKWIHNIDALKRQIGTNEDDELIELGYDVGSYYISH